MFIYTYTHTHVVFLFSIICFIYVLPTGLMKKLRREWHARAPSVLGELGILQNFVLLSISM